MADRTGEQWGNYHLIRLLGQGSFAEVYLGEHVHLGIKAAIKILHSYLTGSEITTFQMEAKTIADLKHPHIVRVLDFAVHESRPFLVMDYAPHSTVRSKFPRGMRLSPLQVIVYTQQIASALQYAHDHKLIHRDIKPENMLLDEEDKVLLSDFGIATISHATASMNTQTSMGTLAYMAPEQIQGKPRLASDQYALGITVYQWLSGHLPFSGSSTEVIAQHLGAIPPSLRESVPGISAETEQIVLKALAKDPKDRFATVQAFATALSSALGRDAEALHSPSLLQEEEDEPYLEAPIPMLLDLTTASQAQYNPAPVISQSSSPTPIVRTPLPVASKPTRRLRIGPKVAATLAVLIVLASIAGIMISQEYQKQVTANTTATAQASSVRARATTKAGLQTVFVVGYATSIATPRAGVSTATSAASNMYPYPQYIQGSGTLALTDPLADNSRGNSWEEGTGPNGSCIFEGGTYHVTEPNTYRILNCPESARPFSNYTLAVDMTVVKGACGGIMFGGHNSSDYYTAFVCQNGEYDLYYNPDKTKTPDHIMAQGYSTSIHTGTNQRNTIALVVNSGHYTLYVNQQQICNGSDGGSGTAPIGLVAASYESTTEVTYQNISIWV